MTQLQCPDEIFPKLLRKIFNESVTEPFVVTKEELKEVRVWKRELDSIISSVLSE